MTSVLITCMSSTTAISVAKGLRIQKELAVRIVGVDVKPANRIAGPDFCNAFITIPSAYDKEYIPSLLRICQDERIEVLFPIEDVELQMLAANKREFAKIGTLVWVSNFSTVTICNNKQKTFLFFRDNKIRTPRTMLSAEALSAVDTLTFPLIVKPIDGSGSIDVHRVDTPATLREILKRVKNPIVQEYIEGPEYTIDVVSNMCSEPLAASVRERCEIRADVSYRGRTVSNKQLSDECMKISRLLRIIGPCNIQCRMRGEIAVFFEVNPRFSGSLPLTIAAGLNIPLILLKLSLNHDISPEYLMVKSGVFMARYWEETFYSR